jgi:hypothetical protein
MEFQGDQVRKSQKYEKRCSGCSVGRNRNCIEYHCKLTSKMDVLQSNHNSCRKKCIKVSYKIQMTIMINWNAAQTRKHYTKIEYGLQTLDGGKLGSLVRDSTDFGKKAIDHS